MSFTTYRTTLETLLDDHLAFASGTGANTERVKALQAQLDQGELSIAVVGEINRGKSTFLNALLGETVFPSRSMICTAGVTVLDHDDTPRAEVVYRDGSTDDIDLEGEAPAKVLKKVVSRSNRDVQDIQVTRVWYPNPFTGNGIVLVDTPGVNDPDHWREDITYSYLAEADAVIMLLDPMQPLSASEIEFLDTKILDRSIANLIFVVNKIDDVPQSDRESALRRIEQILAEHVPNPTIYPVAAKPALEAKQAGTYDKAKATGMPAFEDGLLDFLARGRGGMLLNTKVQQGIQHLDQMGESVQQRRGALDQEKAAVRTRLQEARSKLDALDGKRDRLSKEVANRKSAVQRSLQQAVDQRADHLANTLAPTLASEVDTSVLREQALRFQRDSVSAFRNAIDDTLDNLIDEYDAASAQLSDQVHDVLSNLNRDASNRAQSMQVERRRRDRSSEHERRKAGAALGAGVGAAAGAATAASATTTAVTATGIATTSAFGTAGVIGIGALTGGLGLLIGLGAAALLGGSGESEPENRYVQGNEIVDNQGALQALQGFVERLRSSIQPVSKGIINSAQAAIITPIEDTMQSQRRLIKQIEEDLKETAEGQEDLRETLAGRKAKIDALRERYTALSSDLEAITG